MFQYLQFSEVAFSHGKNIYIYIWVSVPSLTILVFSIVESCFFFLFLLKPMELCIFTFLVHLFYASFLLHLV